MKILNLTNEPREGFAVTASLNLHGHRVFYVQLGSRLIVNKVKIQLDTGSVTTDFIEVPVVFSKRYKNVLQQLLIKEIGDFDVIIISSNSLCLSLVRPILKVYQVPLIVRVSDLGTIGKFWEAIKLFRYYYVIPSLPLSFLRLYRSLVSSDLLIAHTNLISKFLEHHLSIKNLLIYPTYAKVIARNSQMNSVVIEEIMNSVNVQPLILGITSISRPGLAGRHDRLAFECLYKVAKYNPALTVVIIGTGYKEARTIFNNKTLPSNLKLLGKIYDDLIIEQMYKIASLVVVPFFFRKTISNRVLEALFYGRPTLISSYLKDDFPMLKHGENVLMFDGCDKLPYLVRYILKSDDLLSRLEKGAKKVWKEEFSSEIFGLKMSYALKSLFK